MAKLTDGNLEEIKDFLINYFSENPDELLEILRDGLDEIYSDSDHEHTEYITENDLSESESPSIEEIKDSVIEEIKDRL